MCESVFVKRRIFRVLTLERKKKTLIPVDVKVNNAESDTDSEGDADVSEVFDWRSKNSFI